jgi:flagellar motor switch protein FliN/FliY
MSSSQISSSSEAAQPPETPRSQPAAAHPLAGMLDVTCTVDVIVGDGTITVRDCLKLKRHSVIRLRRQAGSDLAIHVQGVPIATGEIVVVDDRTAVRISRITTPPGTEGSS